MSYQKQILLNALQNQRRNKTMQNLKDYYQRIRANGANAFRAYELAKQNFDKQRKLYELPTKETIYYNPQNEDGNRWVENAGEGLRFTGYCDQLNRFIQHKGYYCDEFGDSILRGVVYQLPARKGKTQYIAGYSDPDNEGAALLNFNDIYDDENDAARSADQFAEREAENQREYNEAWQAGNQYAGKGEDLSSLRKATIELLQAIKNKQSEPVICKAIRSQINSQLAEYSELKKSRFELIERFNSNWQKNLWTAFNDGASQEIITN